MRALPARRLASTALCALLLAGVTGPAAVAADPAHEHTHATSQAPVPGADALLAQVKSLGDLGTVLKPVTDLLNTVLGADNGQLTADQATQLGDAVKAAIAQITAAAPTSAASPAAAKPATPAAPPTTAAPSAPPATPTAPATPARPSASGLPSASAVPSAPAVPAAFAVPAPDQGKGLGGAPSAKGLTSDALTALQTAVDNLLKAATSGDVSQVLPAATAVVTGLVNLVAAILLGTGLPAPKLPGLPGPAAVPGLPASTPLPLPPA
ncbi:hypothetical protein ABTY98_11460 [Streptomyces sp. NPDC096040]|uniref:hypothetical protein n=1 Tax=Streptomyces sp. NPDC096040 TaxID=3155541 RepID=UPI00332944E4